jgi:hypothetical protein
VTLLQRWSLHRGAGERDVTVGVCEYDPDKNLALLRLVEPVETSAMIDGLETMHELLAGLERTLGWRLQRESDFLG